MGKLIYKGSEILAKILICDDEEYVREGIIKTISWNKIGIHSIEQASDGIIGYEKALQFQPDILLTDVRMPQMDGVELAHAIKSLFPRCKIIFMSGYSDKEYLKSAINLKAIKYVEKPIDPEEMFEAISQAYSIYMEEEKQRIAIESIRKDTEELQIIKKNELVLDLISGNISIENINERAKQTNLSLPLKGDYVVIALKLKQDDLSKSDLGDISYRSVKAILDNIISLHNLNGLSVIKNDNYIISVIYERNETNMDLILVKVKRIANELLSANQNIDIFIGIGSKVNGVENISKSYKTAVLAQHDLFYTGYNKFKIYEEINDTFYEYDNTVLKEFIQFLQMQNTGEALNLIKQLTDKFKKNKNVLSDYVKNIYFKIFNSFIKISEENGFLISQIHSVDFLWKTVSDFETLDALENFIIENLNAYSHYLNEKASQNRIVNKIILILQEHHTNPNLTIKDISTIVGLSHAYLCVIFKAETKKTINQYLTEYRIEKAQEYLKQKHEKLYEIASKVGYKDHNYFTRTFKKITNMTPSEFREKYSI